MSNASVDDAALDALKMILNGRHGREQAITSAELADRIDGLTQSSARAATKALMRETDMVVLGCNEGYHLPAGDIDVAEVVRELGDRIDGIERRQRLLVDNWAKRRRERGLDSDDPEDRNADTQTAETTLFDFEGEAVATDGGRMEADS
jgi:hypothetical protein